MLFIAEIPQWPDIECQNKITEKVNHTEMAATAAEAVAGQEGAGHDNFLKLPLNLTL